jgi:hypothetical protein
MPASTTSPGSELGDAGRNHERPRCDDRYGSPCSSSESNAIRVPHLVAVEGRVEQRNPREPILTLVILYQPARPGATGIRAAAQRHAVDP